MAEKTILVDDLNGDEHADAVLFAVHGKEYEIHLAKRGQKTFDDAMKPFIKAARVINGDNRDTIESEVKKRPAKRRAAARRAKVSAKKKSSDADELRAWAKANGHNVAARGRLSADVRKAFDEWKAKAKNAESKPDPVEPSMNGAALAAV